MWHLEIVFLEHCVPHYMLVHKGEALPKTRAITLESILEVYQKFLKVIHLSADKSYR